MAMASAEFRSYWKADYGSDYDVDRELKAFDETKAGVKGLVDAGIEQVPPYFVVRPEEVSSHPSSLQLPVVDLKDIHQDSDQRKRVTAQLMEAAGTWGFFQVVNHGVPKELIEGMLHGVRSFHELPQEEKAKHYSRDSKNLVRFLSNSLLFKQKAADWKDTLHLSMLPNVPPPETIPEICREVTIKYSAVVHNLGRTLLTLLSEALGLEPSRLIDMECANGQHIVGNYYPPCPQPNRTFASIPHTDPNFLTILAQDNVGGLQVFYQNQWIDCAPVPGAFVINIGDLLQLISNDKLKSCLHRVVPTNASSRVTVACFLTTYARAYSKLYGPVKELLSDENPPLYRDVMVKDYITEFTQKGFNALDRFML